VTIMIRSKVIKIGNSKGIRIPRALLDQAGLTNEVEMTVEGNKLIIHSIQSNRQDWSTLFDTMSENGDDQLLDQISATQWEKEEWTW